MKKITKRAIVLGSSLVLIIAMVISVPALLNLLPVRVDGNFEHKIVNRMDFLVRNTEFSFKLGDGAVYTMDIELSAKKTEADFYGVLNSVEVSGMDFDSCVVTASTEAAGTPQLPNAVLPAADGKPVTAVYNIRIVFKSPAAAVFKPVINIRYSSGVKIETAQEYLLSVDVTARVS